MDQVIIVGGGITGLALALSLHEAGIPCRIFEAAPTFKPLGVGINLLPHAVRELTQLGLQPALAARAVETREMNYYNKFGQFIYSEPRGRFAGYEWPQFSIHRSQLHEVLFAAVCERVGPDAVTLGHRCCGFEQNDDGVTLHFADPASGLTSSSVTAAAAIGCDGIHSQFRRQLFPHEGPPAFQGINMWRGVTRWKPFLSGATMVQAGWLDVGKMVVYPISSDLDDQGRQLINWVAELRSPRHTQQDWTAAGRLDDILPIFADWNFPWLNVAEMMRRAHVLLEFPMIDRDPLSYWTTGRVTLVGDAAHPMYPRGGNGAGQGILDARALARSFRSTPNVTTALKAYEAERLAAANKVVLMNRVAPPDKILQLVHQRSGGVPFKEIGEIVSPEELAAISEEYKRTAGFDKLSLSAKS